MLRLLRNLRARHEVAVVCPPEGPLADALDEHGIRRLPIRGTDVSFRLRPLTTTRGLAALAASSLGLARAIRRWRPAVVHANGVRAGLLTAPVARLTRTPLVVQVHDNLPEGRLGRLVRRAIAAGAGEVLAVSRSTAARFDAGLSRPVARTVYISFDREHFLAPQDCERTRAELGIGARTPLLGEVAQITPWKGQREAIETLAAVRRRHPDAMLLLIGHVAFAGKGVRYDNAAYLAELQALVRELGLDDAVRFLGRRTDVPALVSALDVMLLPSWDEPFGTAVLEAMATGTVPAVGSCGGPAEYVQDGVAGLVLPPREPAIWAEAISDLLDDPARLAAMGARAREVAARFTDRAYADGCMAAYAAALSRASSARVRATA
jgi:glycosyltransferase involved in cell wall biosynthesis